jgi:hypothetical protein
VHEQVRLLAKETGKGHSDIKQKKKNGRISSSILVG